MTKQEAIAAIRGGAVLMYCSAVMGLSASASINNQPVRIDTARKLMRDILKMDKKFGYTSYWSLNTKSSK
jgi:hypothetical protein